MGKDRKILRMARLEVEELVERFRLMGYPDSVAERMASDERSWEK